MELTLLQLNEAKSSSFHQIQINLEIGDILIMIGHDNDLNRFEKILRRDNREWDRNDIFSKFISSSYPNSHCL